MRTTRCCRAAPTRRQRAGHSVLHPITRDERSPLELYEALNAVQIADAAGAGKYAADTMATAKTALQNAEDNDTHKHDRKETITYAREAVQSAEDARIITIRKIKAEDDAAVQQARLDAEQQAQRSQADAQQAQLAAQQSQLAAEQQAAERAKAEAAAAEAQAQAQRARDAQQAAEQGAQQASQQAEQARECLKAQLNAVLQTTENRPRLDRQHVRRAVRLQQIHVEAGSARKAGQGLRNPARVSWPEASGGRLHG